ncbi:hypothetical protein IHC87_04205 [Photobacterium damselae subsp. damselae]|uniref:hypothetical protein n=1 Tax=Photobacterium damselae TaxID=38293 RepID=UPI001F4524DC|nr:hypothetical protein [Photobacterium damselae]UJZ94576.1 hypothetical protein IHC87_04205 [Photobacterium damselae subsp. damselae]
MTSNDILAYSLNYFDTYDSLKMVLKDYHAFDFFSFLLPFNKILNLFSGGDDFFDISAYLTNIYFPHAWNIRATVQYPIEVDLYLSFGYWLGLPFMVIFMLIYIVVYNLAMKSIYPIVIFIWFYLFIYILSHLRGGIILWTDLYTYPYLITLFIVYRKKLFMLIKINELILRALKNEISVDEYLINKFYLNGNNVVYRPLRYRFLNKIPKDFNVIFAILIPVFILFFLLKNIMRKKNVYDDVCDIFLMSSKKGNEIYNEHNIDAKIIKLNGGEYISYLSYIDRLKIIFYLYGDIL